MQMPRHMYMHLIAMQRCPILSSWYAFFYFYFFKNSVLVLRPLVGLWQAPRKSRRIQAGGTVNRPSPWGPVPAAISISWYANTIHIAILTSLYIFMIVCMYRSRTTIWNIHSYNSYTFFAPRYHLSRVTSAYVLKSSIECLLTPNPPAPRLHMHVPWALGYAKCKPK